MTDLAYEARVPLPRLVKSVGYGSIPGPHPQTFQADPPAKPDATVAGFAYVFALPFDVELSPDLNTARDATVDGVRGRIHPPFRSDDRTGHEVEHISSPRIPISSDEGRSAAGVSHFFTMRIHRGIDPSSVLANALSISCFQPMSPSHVTAIAARVIGLIRWYTWQWWVGRDRRHTDAMLRHVVPIHADGHCVRSLSSYTRLYGKPFVSNPLTGQLFTELVEALQADHYIPESVELMLDAIYHHAMGDLRRSVLDAATAGDAMFTEAVARLVARKTLTEADVKKIRNPKSSAKFGHRLKELEKLVGSSDSPASVFSPVWTRLRQARNNVAHAAPVGDGLASYTLADQFASLEATFFLANWLNRLAPRPDPRDVSTARA